MYHWGADNRWMRPWIVTSFFVDPLSGRLSSAVQMQVAVDCRRLPFKSRDLKINEVPYLRLVYYSREIGYRKRAFMRNAYIIITFCRGSNILPFSKSIWRRIISISLLIVCVVNGDETEIIMSSSITQENLWVSISVDDRDGRVRFMVSVKCLNDSHTQDSPKSLTPQNCPKLKQWAYN